MDNSIDLDWPVQLHSLVTVRHGRQVDDEVGVGSDGVGDVSRSVRHVRRQVFVEVLCAHVHSVLYVCDL